MRRWLRRGLFLSLGSILLWFGAAALLPFPHERLAPAPRNTRFLDAEGGLLRRTLSKEGVDQDWISFDQTGPWVAPALIAVEDQRFYQHIGVDPIAVVRAMKQNVVSGEVVSGASTLSSQVIRMLDPNRKRTLITKVVEFFRATQMEMRYEKEFILEQYVNRAPMGGNRYGVATGARRYFGKEPSMLSAGEASLLMGLPQSPSRYRPNEYPERAEKRRETVLRRMREEGMLTQEVLRDTGVRWVSPPIRAYPFTEWVRRRHGHAAGEIQTTLDPDKQAVCEQIVASIQNEAAYADTDGVGVVLLEANSGKVLAWVGGWDPRDPQIQQVDTVTRPRAPGSTLKPFAFALGMQRGWLTPKTLLEDRPRMYRDYQPTNMDERWSGEVTAKDALVRSLNFPALQVVERTGVQAFLHFLRRCGPAYPSARAENVGLGAVLGGGMEISLLELTSAYTVFANEGIPCSPTAVEPQEHPTSAAMSPGTAYWISRMLSGRERDERLYGYRADVERPDMAFKTGTSHGHRDAWAIGWNGEYVLGVWVGRLDGNKVSGLSGLTQAAPLLGQLALELFPSGNWPQPTSDIVQVEGHERIRGRTDPQAGLDPVSEIKGRILSPRPEFVWRGLDDQPLRLDLKAAAPADAEIHWFHNGEWIGKTRARESLPHVFPKGSHTIRAVFPGSRADTRTVMVL